jgi:hypothetical protein
MQHILLNVLWCIKYHAFQRRDQHGLSNASINALKYIQCTSYHLHLCCIQGSLVQFNCIYIIASCCASFCHSHSRCITSS